MNSLYIIKQVDWILQALAFFIPALVALVFSNLYFLLYIPIYVGVVQLASYLLNKLMLNDKYQSDQRTTYGWMLLVAAVISVVMLVFKFRVLMWVVLAMVPLMALLYFYISVNEASYLGKIARRKRYI